MEERKYIRHPSTVKIDFELAQCVTDRESYLNDISIGGLSFKSKINIESGTVINIKIPLVNPRFAASGVVRWCRENNGGYYDVGVEFHNKEEMFKTRMVEQICYIEEYKKKIYEKERRILTDEQAALEWIKKYADKFPGYN
jgi:hypothetical protein